MQKTKIITIDISTNGAIGLLTEDTNLLIDLLLDNRETESKPGAAAETAESGKRRKYASLLESYIFVPFAVETLGGWGHGVIVPINSFVTSTGDRRAGSFFAERIRLAVQRGNAASILATIPRGQDLYSN